MNRRTPHYDIFVCYRRDGSFDTAALIADRLRNAGHRVFLDVESLKSGKFDSQLLDVIDVCTDFILILPKGGLDRCVDPEDWVRQEVIHATRVGKNIIPVMLRGFEWPNPMPEGLDGLQLHNGVSAGAHEYFDASVDRLKEFLESKPWASTEAHRKWLLIASLIVVSAGTTVGYAMYDSNLSYVRDCMSVATALGDEVARIGDAYQSLAAAQHAFGAMAAKLNDSTSANDLESVVSSFSNSVDTYLDGLPGPSAAMNISDSMRRRLSEKGVQMESIDRIGGITDPYVAMVRETLVGLKKMTNMSCIPQVMLRMERMSLDMSELQVRLVVVDYYRVLSRMPDLVWESAYEMEVAGHSWSNEIPPRQSSDYYKVKWEDYILRMKDIGNVTKEAMAQAAEMLRNDKCIHVVE